MTSSCRICVTQSCSWLSNLLSRCHNIPTAMNKTTTLHKLEVIESKVGFKKPNYRDVIPKITSKLLIEEAKLKLGSKVGGVDQEDSIILLTSRGLNRLLEGRKNFSYLRIQEI